MNSTRYYSPILQYTGQELTARDEELVRAARAGSHTAFSELQSLYAHRLYKHILSITRNREDAEDALQDTFLCAYRALPSFEGRSRLSSWLTRIAINSALMILRRRRSCPETSLELQSGGDEDSISFDVRDSAPSPAQLYDQHQRCEAVRRAIQLLEPKMRNAMNSRILQGKSVQEAACSLGISSASVKSRLYRARKRLVQSPDLRAHNAALRIEQRYGSLVANA